MRQRNTSGYVLDVWAYPTEQDPDRRPFTVGPQEEIDFPELLAGFTAIGPESGPDAGAPARARKTTAAKTDAEGGDGK